MSSFYIQLLIWVAVIGVSFGLLWKFGYLARFASYVGDTRDELKKCAWPSRDELIETTVMVLVTVGILGIFLMVVDWGVLGAIKLLIGGR
ncbi:MAG: preprotein translocase subunit SecE [Verrucomicrobia bacterium]|nr:preprotein translocase subunit SecE [Verrucomicrobiota bacterium]